MLIKINLLFRITTINKIWIVQDDFKVYKIIKLKSKKFRLSALILANKIYSKMGKNYKIKMLTINNK